MVIGEGQGTFVDFDARALGIVDRTQLRVEVQLQQPLDPAAPSRSRLRADDVILTLEVFDAATGKTMFTVPFTTGQ